MFKDMIESIFSTEESALRYYDKIIEDITFDKIDSYYIKKCRVDASSVVFGLFIYFVSITSKDKKFNSLRIPEYYFEWKPDSFNKVNQDYDVDDIIYWVYVRADSRKEGESKGQKLINEYIENSDTEIIFRTKYKN